MAKMSQNVKEIIQVVVFVLVVAILIIVFVVYPLNRTKAFLARPDVDSFKPDPLPTNDISAFAEFRATVDTFRVDADGLTSLACAYMTPRADTLSPDVVPPIRGSACDGRRGRRPARPLGRRLARARARSSQLRSRRHCVLAKGSARPRIWARRLASPAGTSRNKAR